MWFFEIFADVDSRGRVFAILLSAFLAFLGIRYTQNKTTERESKAHLLDKYEEIVSGIDSLLDKRATLDSFTHYNKEELTQAYTDYSVVKDSITSLAVKIDMLLSIYSPSTELAITAALKSQSQLEPAEAQTIHLIAFLGHFQQIEAINAVADGNTGARIATEQVSAKSDWDTATVQLRTIKRSVISKARALAVTAKNKNNGY